MDIKVIVATHKPYRMPSDDVYLPLQVGAAGKTSITGFTRDDVGIEISAKNATFCELTGLYWAWRNLKADAVGLVHYRRHFKGEKGVALGDELARLLENHEVILPRRRNYFIETTYSQYVHAHHAQDLDVTRQILSERHPDYVASFDRVMKSTKGHRFNMFVMRWPQFDAYCSWLFDVLFELEHRLDISSYSPYDARVFGFVGERLLDVWLGVQVDVRMTELPVLHLESQHWPTKIMGFLSRKLRG